MDQQTGLIDAVRALPAIGCAEVWSSGPHEVGLGIDADVQALFEQLVSLARCRGGRLHNPQTGEDEVLGGASRLPSGWLPTGSVRGKALGGPFNP